MTQILTIILWQNMPQTTDFQSIDTDPSEYIISWATGIMAPLVCDANLNKRSDRR